MNRLAPPLLNQALVLSFTLSLALPAEAVSATAPRRVASRVSRSVEHHAGVVPAQARPGGSYAIALWGECNGSETEAKEHHRSPEAAGGAFAAATAPSLATAPYLFNPADLTLREAVSSARPRAPPSVFSGI